MNEPKTNQMKQSDYENRYYINQPKLRNTSMNQSTIKKEKVDTKELISRLDNMFINPSSSKKN